ncbi:unnamed protein product [Cuscuta campestris]|uniref:Uncharacterized protein n=1 Tax=Cuscuta campestris TaxID=132261 RepID=A0A484NDU1_9ASTE|nr:unnamed protein product [Cuscuta campestris]
MAPSANPATWVHESSIIKEDELREMAESLSKGFRIHHPDAVGGISLSHNLDPQKHMVMHYHTVGNGFRLPLHGLVRDICQTFEFPPGVSSPGRSKAPPTVESHPVEGSSRSQAQGDTTALAICTPSAALEAVPISAIHGLRKPTPSQKRPREGVTDDDFLPKKSKGDGVPASPNPLAASSGTGELELPNPVSLDREADKSPDQAQLQRPTGRSHPVVENTSPPTATTPQGMEKEIGGQKETEEQHSAAAPPTFNLPIYCRFTLQTYPVFKDGWAGFSRGLNSLKASHSTIQVNLEKMKGLVQDPIIPEARPDLLALDVLHSMEQTQRSFLTLTEEYLGGAWGNYRAMVVFKDKELAARALQQKVGFLKQQVHALQEENSRLKADASTELLAERSRVKSLQEQIATYKGSTQDLETQFNKLRAQISNLESKVSALEGKEGSLKAELVERDSRISELEKSLREAKQEGAHFSEVMLKHLGLKRDALQKLEKERKIVKELRLKVGELEKTRASHQEEVAALTARAEALYEEGKFDVQLCIYYGLPPGVYGERWFFAGSLPSDLFSMTDRAQGKVFIDLTLSGTSSSSDDDLPVSPAQSNDMARLSLVEFSRLYPPSPPSPPRLPSGRIDWDSMTLQDFTLYQRMRKARLGHSFQPAKAELSRESRTASPTLPRSPSDGSQSAPPASRPGMWEDYDMGEADDSVVCPSSERRSPWRGPPPPSS